jgi:nucleoside-diphosphate-sugar epimerase
MKILVTGSRGFLGRHVAKAALDAGHEVLGADLPARVGGVPLFPGEKGYAEAALDLLHLRGELSKALKGAGAVIHCAGLVTGDPDAVLRTNVEGTRNLLAALAASSASAGKPPRFVLLSSMAVFESEPGAYGRSKKEAEELVEAMAPSFVLIRPAMLYGPGDLGWTARVRERVTLKRFLLLPGWGGAKIQPAFVEDAARAIVAAAVCPEAEGAAFHLGGPEPITYRAFYALARDALRGRTRFIPLPLWPFALAGAFLGGRFRAAATFAREDHGVDIEPARRVLGFAPRSAAEGLALTFG